MSWQCWLWKIECSYKLLLVLSCVGDTTHQGGSCVSYLSPSWLNVFAYLYKYIVVYLYIDMVIRCVVGDIAHQGWELCVPVVSTSILLLLLLLLSIVIYSIVFLCYCRCYWVLVILLTKGGSCVSHLYPPPSCYYYCYCYLLLSISIVFLCYCRCYWVLVILLTKGGSCVSHLYPPPSWLSGDQAL